VRRLLLACAAIALLSLIFVPRGMHYDPWAWVVWGREIVTLDLNTFKGPSWKPLPVAFTAVYSPLAKINDDIPPMLWLATGRFFALVALVMVARLAARLAGPNPVAKVTAAVVGVLGLYFFPKWGVISMRGYSEPMAVALMMIGIERHLDGHRNQAFLLGLGVALLRPESWPFFGLYGLFLLYEDRDRWPLVLGGFVTLPVLWLGPDVWGSGDAFQSSEQARAPTQSSLSSKDVPWRAALERADSIVPLPFKVAAVFAVAFAVRKRDWRVVWLGAACIVWFAIVVVMTQAGFSGNLRYFALAGSLAALLAGVGAARLASLAPRPALQAGLAVVLLCALIPYAGDRIDLAGAEVRYTRQTSILEGQLIDAVRETGGPAKVQAIGTPDVNHGFATALAWYIKSPLELIAPGRRGSRIVFQSRNPYAGVPPGFRRGWKVRKLRQVRSWSVLHGTGTPPPDPYAGRR
jgi:hypothetical protein